jgi:hypothetical protein
MRPGMAEGRLRQRASSSFSWSRHCSSPRRQAAPATEISVSSAASTAAKPGPLSGRFDRLDGGRGWRALNVVLFHGL